MGMTYDELSVFGRLRKVHRCGPYSMFTKLLYMWKDKYTVTEVSSLAKQKNMEGEQRCVCRYRMRDVDILNRNLGAALTIIAG